MRTFTNELVTASNYRSFSKEKRRVLNKDLKSYLKGHETYVDGRIEIGGVKVPNRMPVSEKFTTKSTTYKL